MKKVPLLVLVFFTILLLASSITSASRRIGRPRSPDHGGREQLTKLLIEDRAEMKRVIKGLSKSGSSRPDTVQVAGSRLPDCSHACGSCRPCKLVMVSFVCASLEEAETCPMAYKCMCRRKSYPVP